MLSCKARAASKSITGFVGDADMGRVRPLAILGVFIGDGVREEGIQLSSGLALEGSVCSMRLCAVWVLLGVLGWVVVPSILSSRPPLRVGVRCTLGTNDDVDNSCEREGWARISEGGPKIILTGDGDREDAVLDDDEDALEVVDEVELVFCMGMMRIGIGCVWVS